MLTGEQCYNMTPLKTVLWGAMNLKFPFKPKQNDQIPIYCSLGSHCSDEREGSASTVHSCLGVKRVCFRWEQTLTGFYWVKVLQLWSRKDAEASRLSPAGVALCCPRWSPSRVANARPELSSEAFDVTWADESPCTPCISQPGHGSNARSATFPRDWLNSFGFHSSVT